VRDTNTSPVSATGELGSPPRVEEQRVSRLRILGTVAVAALAVAAAFFEPVISVFCVLVALNIIFGDGENVPFSTYSMFSNPPRTAWALRFEDPHGELVPIGKMGINPYITKKRFGTEVRVAREQGVADVDAARRRAAEVIAEQIEQHRPPRGQWSAEPITIVFVEYRLAAGGGRVRAQTALLDTAPA
jgi:hypothetical protein